MAFFPEQVSALSLIPGDRVKVNEAWRVVENVMPSRAWERLHVKLLDHGHVHLFPDDLVDAIPLSQWKDPF